jgi:hypothetical protein
MPKTEADIEETVAAITKKKGPKRATFDLLKNKPRSKMDVKFMFDTGGDEPEEVTLEFRAIGAIEYDKLISKCPPTVEQKADGSAYNIHTFGPELLAVVCVDPEMSLAEWKEIWNSPDWNRGEIVQLFGTALELCNRGLDIPFTKID